MKPFIPSLKMFSQCYLDRKSTEGCFIENKWEPQSDLDDGDGNRGKQKERSERGHGG